MEFVNRLTYHTWNIGFIEDNVNNIVASDLTQVEVHWVKHPYKDRFFADPFILSADEKYIKVLVEEFPYYDKRGKISLLIIDRKTYELTDKKVILKQPFHMSYPFIMRKKNGDVWVAPEASMSGRLYFYTINPETMMLENQRVLMKEPLLDSTIVEYDERWWLFCTKRGENSNKELFIYHSDNPEGPWLAHMRNPVVQDLSIARPAGCFVVDGGELYRVIQKCDNYYGEAINVTKVDKLTTTEYCETFVKELRVKDNEYSKGFHTINGLGEITVVDGVKLQKTPLRRIYYEIRDKFKI